ncbi:hydroxyethylthiazole kinase [Moorella sulfitireducens (nom. illeg.)]|uniref:hydroxyethylthiazole kinase n=1 Tax=Neomoorella sulfitireducens TaxID=2972948 RepID=UPI0021ACDF5B|nr:hydroxyethylthiazole kinase [Moorella sulfitireducens]
MNWGEKVASMRQRVREQRPLVHHITNLVVTNLTANVTLAVGASPVMAYAPEEVADMARLAQAVVLNMGTLTQEVVEAMLLAGKAAGEAGIPVIFDPVGAGATPFRTATAQRIIKELHVDILRGNASEIACLAGLGGQTRGVDAAGVPARVAEMTRQIAQDLGTVVVVTGATDYISDGRRLIAVDNGHPMLTLVTGTGCSATSVIAAFRAVEANGVEAGAAALAYYGLAAEKAAEACGGPASFQVALLDTLYNLPGEALAQGVKIREL